MGSATWRIATYVVQSGAETVLLGTPAQVTDAEIIDSNHPPPRRHHDERPP
ncbi:hypothetical protein ACH4JZ_08850 [Streptomyces sp. NPDC017615]|uniref:hypothetical protein n=1 Tax=Streptomyces sp. NPDC017615 TaxID=3365003 RepID=UPI00379FA6B6